MEPINCNANDSSRQIDTHTKAKRKQHFSKLSHIHTQSERKKTIKESRVTHIHTHSYWWLPLYIQKTVLSQTSRYVCISALFGQSIWVEDAHQRPSLCWGRKQWKLYTHTLTDALIKHGSKNKKSKTKRKASFARFVYTVVALTRLKRIHLCL